MVFYISKRLLRAVYCFTLCSAVDGRTRGQLWRWCDRWTNCSLFWQSQSRKVRFWLCVHSESFWRNAIANALHFLPLGNVKSCSLSTRFQADHTLGGSDASFRLQGVQRLCLLSLHDYNHRRQVKNKTKTKQNKNGVSKMWHHCCPRPRPPYTTYRPISGAEKYRCSAGMKKQLSQEFHWLQW